MATPPRLQVGGNLKLGDLYIRRTEDESVYDLLAAHEFVNILTSRQMGKSSLMVRLHHRLMAERGARVASIDMAGDLGTPPDRELWYRGLLGKIADELGLDHDVDAWWQADGRGTPNQRLLQFFTDVVCAEIAAPIVIFLDEIDATLKLDYSDDLFTAIRSLYNKRAEQPALERLTFCLIGVATTRELIKERRTTPYNVGQTVELRDFDPAVDDLQLLHASLATGGGDGAALLAAILRWTNGHPFLTVALTALAVARKATKAADIDGLVADGGFANSDVVRGHLASISRFLETRLENEAATFRLYNAVLRDRRVPDRSSAAHLELRLSGLVRRGADDHLTVRNPIYRQRFGLAWLRQTRPLITQRRLTRAVIVLSIVLVVGAIVGVRALLKQRERERERTARVERQQRLQLELANAGDDATARATWVAICAGARDQQLPADAPDAARSSWEAYWVRRADQLDAAATAATNPVARTLLHALADVKRGKVSSAPVVEARAADEARFATIHAHQGPVNRVRFLDAEHVASVGADANLRISNIDLAAQIAAAPMEGLAPVLATCPDGSCLLIVVTPAKVVRLSPDLGSRSQLGSYETKLGAITTLAIDGTSTRFAAAGKRGIAQVFKLDAPDRPLAFLAHADNRGNPKAVTAVRFAAGHRLLTAAADGVRSFDLTRDRDEAPSIVGPFVDVDATPDGAVVGAARADVAYAGPRLSGPEMKKYEKADQILSIDLSGDGSRVVDATRQADQGHVVVWDSRDEEVLFERETPLVRDARFSPDGKLVASAHDDGTIVIWQVNPPATAEDAPARWITLQRRLGFTIDAAGHLAKLGNDGPRPAPGFGPAACP